MNNNELMYTCNSCGAKLKNNTKNRLIECPYCKSDIVFLEKGIDKYNIVYATGKKRSFTFS